MSSSIPVPVRVAYADIVVPRRWSEFAYEYRHGFIAALDGTLRNHNPVFYGSVHRDAWAAGWREGRRVTDGDIHATQGA